MKLPILSVLFILITSKEVTYNAKPWREYTMIKDDADDYNTICPNFKISIMADDA